MKRDADYGDYQGRMRAEKAYINLKTGKITINLDKAESYEDAVESVLHEAVGHYGLRQIIGADRYDRFMDALYASSHKSIREEVDSLKLRRGYGSIAVAMDEYLAGLAERGRFTAPEQTLWKKLVRWVRLRLGLPHVSRRDLSDMVTQSYRNLTLGQRVNVAEDNVYGNVERLLNAVFKKMGVAVTLKGSRSPVRFRPVMAGSGGQVEQAKEERERRELKEAYKKAFKKGGEKLFEVLYDNQNTAVTQHGEAFLSYLKEVIGDKTDALHIVENNHTWLMLDFAKKHPQLFSTEEAVEATRSDIPDAGDLLRSHGYTLLEHTEDNGQALGLMFMYRDGFVKDGTTDAGHTPDEEFFGRSVICYYSDPMARLEKSYVFTVEHDRARTTPTANELAANPGLMTPEWEAFLAKSGRKRGDGTYNLKGLEARFDDPFSLSFLMIRIKRDAARGVEIISRYNHRSFTKEGREYIIGGEPNATLDGKLNRLVEGLENSLLAHRSISEGYAPLLEGWVRMANNGKLYHPTREVNGVYIGSDFYIKRDNNAVHIDSGREAILGGYVVSAANTVYDIGNDSPLEGFDRMHKTRVTPGLITFYKGGHEETVEKEVVVRGEKKVVQQQRWVDDYKTEIRINKEGIFLESDMPEVDDATMTLVDKARITGLTLTKVRNVRNWFLNNNTSLMQLSLPEAERAGNNFMSEKGGILQLYAPKLASVGESFLYHLSGTSGVSLPSLRKAGNGFLSNATNFSRLELPALEEAGDNFLLHADVLPELELPSLRKVGKNFVANGNALTRVSLPALERAGESFLRMAITLGSLELPQLRSAGSYFLQGGFRLEQLDAPALEEVGNGFLQQNTVIRELRLPALRSAGINFMHDNEKLERVSLPSLQEAGESFLSNNKILRELELPQVRKVGRDFLLNNYDMERLSLPELVEAGSEFLPTNAKLLSLSLPKVEAVGRNFLEDNKALTGLALPRLRTAGNRFLFNNTALQELLLPALETAGDSFLFNNTGLTRLALPSLRTAGDSFMYNNEALRSLSLPSLETAKNSFMAKNKVLTVLALPSLRTAGNSFLYNNEALRSLSLPSLETVEDNFLYNNTGLTRLAMPRLRTAVGRNSWLWEVDNEGRPSAERFKGRKASRLQAGDVSSTEVKGGRGFDRLLEEAKSKKQEAGEAEGAIRFRAGGTGVEGYGVSKDITSKIPVKIGNHKLTAEQREQLLKGEAVRLGSLVDKSGNLHANVQIKLNRNTNKVEMGKIKQETPKPQIKPTLKPSRHM